MSHVAEHCGWGEPNIGYLGVLPLCHLLYSTLIEEFVLEGRGFKPKFFGNE